MPQQVTIATGDNNTRSDEPVLWRPTQRVRRSLSCRMLEAAAAGLLLLAYGIHLERLGSIRDDLMARIEATQQSATAVQRLAARVNSIEAAATFLDSRRAAISPLQVLDETTKLVPSNSWASNFTLKDGVVEVSGYSARATDLIAPIENSSLFESPRFRAPISLFPDGKGERFDLEFHIKQGMKP